MGKIALISGPIKSGKSKWAEHLAKDSGLNSITYLATQANQFKDEEMDLRIKVHQSRRSKDWHTLEAYQDLAPLLPQEEGVGLIFDCVTVWATNLFFDQVKIYGHLEEEADLDAYIESFSQADIAYFNDFLVLEMKKIVEAMHESKSSFWIVTNELGWTLTSDTFLGRLFVDYIGRLNQYLAQEAHEVYLLVMGLAQQLK